MKRFFLILLSTFILMTTVAANEQPLIDDDTNGLTTISIGVYGDLESAYTAVFASEDFKTRFPDVVMEIIPADIGGHHNRLVTQIAAGTGTNDIEALEAGYIARFVSDGGLTDLAKSPYKGIEAGKELVKFGMSNATTKDGRLVAMPVDIAPAVMFYRKSIVAEAGVNMESIKDWDEYIEIGKKLTVDKDGDGSIDQWAITHPNDLWIIPLNGGKGDWFDQSGNPFSPKDRFMGVLKLVKDIRSAGIDANFVPWSGEWVDGFKENKVVTMFSGAWLGGHFKNWMCPDLSGDWAVTYPPGKAYSSFGGTYLTIPEQVKDKRKAVAWEIIKYLSTTEAAQLLSFKTADIFPALTTVFDDPVMDEPVEYYGGQKVRQIFQDIALNIPVQEVSEFDAIAVNIYTNAVAAVVNDGVSVEEAYKLAKNELLGMMN